MQHQSLIKSLLTRKVAFGATLGGAVFFMVIGIILWGGFNTAMEVTNTMPFCTSCHEMRDNVYAEYRGTAHDVNPSGVGATCSDCHVPRPWIHKVVRKIEASRELYHKALGTVNTPEKFDARRLVMAERVWSAMKQSDSRECRNCHDWDSMNPEGQKPRARNQHLFAMREGHTCIDCHMGIAHSEVHNRLSDEELERFSAPRAEHRREVPEEFLVAMARAEAAEAEAEAARQAEAQRELERRGAARKAEEERIHEAVARALEAVGLGEVPETEAVSPAGFDVDWSGVPQRLITLLYPGHTSMEWTLVGQMHGGARPFRAGDTCLSCHGHEAEAMGQKMVTGEKAEDTPPEGKRPGIPVLVQATHDNEHIYLRFEWEGTEHVPVPFVEGGRMDPDNPVKLAVMLSTDKPEYASQAGCWGACHHDLRGMPEHPEDPAASGLPLDFTEGGVTKYLKESRTHVEELGRRGATLGGWENLKEPEELAELLNDGVFMDLMRVSSDGSTEHGHILEQRIMTGGQGFEAALEQRGESWLLVMKRSLESDRPGDVSIEPGKVYNFSFAIHDDYADGRFHHVSLGYRLGLDNPDVAVNVVGQ